MKTKFLLSALLMLFFLNSVNAQSHKLGQANYNCKLNKKGWFFNSEKLSCPACEATDKKEKAAKAAEDKRRSDLAVAKAKTDKAASDLANKKKQQDIAEKNKVTEVAVTMPKSTAVKNTNPDKKAESKGMAKNYFYTERNDIDNQSISSMWGPKNQSPTNYFIINNVKKFTNNEFKACIGSMIAYRDKEKFNFPANIGIVVLNETFTLKNGENIQILDLIDSNGKRILNDNSISIIIHFADDYFIAFRGKPWFSYGNNNVRFVGKSIGDAFIYNIKTKQKYLMKRYTSNGVDLGYDVDFIVNLSYSFKDKEELSKYKARFVSKTGNSVYTEYYITKESKLEERIKQN